MIVGHTTEVVGGQRRVDLLDRDRPLRRVGVPRVGVLHAGQGCRHAHRIRGGCLNRLSWPGEDGGSTWGHRCLRPRGR